jgi:hypothetical protein
VSFSTTVPNNSELGGDPPLYEELIEELEEDEDSSSEKDPFDRIDLIDPKWKGEG